MKRKLMAIILSCAMTATILAGCGSADAPAADAPAADAAADTAEDTAADTADAAADIRAIAALVTKAKGGEGVIREVAEMVLNL